MPNSQSISELNREFARQINEEARNDHDSPYFGKFVGVSNGQIVAVADDLDELVQRLRQGQADLSRTLCLEVGLDYDQVQEIWGLR